MTFDKIVKPHRLKTNARLGIIAPSTPIILTDDKVNRGYDYLRKKGFQIDEAKACRLKTGHTAGSIQERVDSIHKFLRDDSIDAIMAFWGGYQSHQLLEYLDFDLIAKARKPIIGYSDITALSLGIYSQTGLVSFSGACVISFVKPDSHEYTWKSFESVLMNPTATHTYSHATSYSDNKWWEKDVMEWEPNASWKTFKAGKAEGRLIGGNTGTMLLLCGTKYFPDLNGAILFLEEDEAENTRTIDRQFTQLRQMGVFDKINGLIIGRSPRSMGFTKEDSFEMILETSLAGYDIPVLYDVDFGHTDPMMTIPVGIRAQLDAGTKTISLLEPAVE